MTVRTDLIRMLHHYRAFKMVDEICGGCYRVLNQDEKRHLIYVDSMMGSEYVHSRCGDCMPLDRHNPFVPYTSIVA